MRFIQYWKGYPICLWAFVLFCCFAQLHYFYDVHAIPLLYYSELMTLLEHLRLLLNTTLRALILGHKDLELSQNTIIRGITYIFRASLWGPVGIT